MWHDIIPAIPLARGVPVFLHGPKGRVKGVTHGIDYVATAPTAWDDGLVYIGPDEVWLVDLDADQGFGYAVRWYALNGDPWSVASLWSLRTRWFRGLTSDEDRLVLAQALEEVRS